ncbi:DUF3108 domain-containing protein [Aquiflexum sp.]|uniref:DUF3108 domain-containing protein n=1 Tax=Aquiflexum sp. TaxID=1872584 RepID=UPI0035943D66
MKKHLKKSVVVTFFFLLGLAGAFAQKNMAFQGGEELTFKVSYMFFDAAEAKMVVNSEISSINSRPTYKIDVFGQTLGVFKLFKVNDNWGSYLDTAKMIPHQSYRHIEEGRYRKHERVIFDHNKKNAHVRLYDHENKNLVETKDYNVPSNVQDIVSGFYLLRTMDLKKLKKGEIVTLTGFFDKEIYNLKLIYGGKESVSTNIGTFDTFVFSPIMPKNKLFRGERPVTVWISDDKNKIPLKIKAKLMVGSLDMEIMEVSGLRNN